MTTKAKAKPRTVDPVRARFTITVLESGKLRWRNHGLTTWEVLPILAQIHEAVGKEVRGPDDAT